MEAIGQLTGGVAHDFNNLLTVVLGSLESIQRNAASLDAPTLRPRMRRAADDAMRGAQRAAALTQRLLAFSRRQPLDPKPSTSTGWSPACRELLRRTWASSIEIETVLAGGLWRTLRRPQPARERAPQPRGQCPRRHAGRRQADHRDRQRAISTRSTPPTSAEIVRRPVRADRRHRHRHRHDARGDERRRSSRSSPPRTSARAPASGLARSTASSSRSAAT